MGERQPVSQRAIRQATSNYIDCLRLPHSGDNSNRILIVTDSHATDANAQTRLHMADALSQRLEQYPLVRVGFDHTTTREEIFSQTAEALHQLDRRGEEISSAELITTAIYIGDAWVNRGGMYKAIGEYSNSKPKGNVRVAGSLGFSTGDLRVAAQMGEEQRAKIAVAERAITGFFQENPQGLLEMTTQEKQNAYTVALPYDATEAPPASETGEFDDNHINYVHGYRYLNIPGGELFFAPYKFQDANGQFTAESLIFTVEKGMLVEVEEAQKGTREKINEPAKRQLIDLIQNGRGMPIAELGIGFYEIAGIKTYKDSSILTKEKGAAHIAFGHVVSPTPEAEEVAQAAGDYEHMDFITRGAIIYAADGKRTQVYPPEPTAL